MTAFIRFFCSRKLAVVLFLALIGIEASYLVSETNPLRAAAAWAWVIISVVLLGFVLLHSLLPCLQKKFWKSPGVLWYLTVLLIPLCQMLFGVNGYRYTQINEEGIREVVCGLDLIANRHDLGLFSLGFVGYPVRHYILAAMPSCILGRSLITLRIGFGALYFVSYISFLAAVRKFLEAKQAAAPMLLSSLAGALVALGSYPLLYSRLYEQAIVPLSATMLFLGGLLTYLRRPNPWAAIWLIWALGFMPYLYTPALSSWAAGMAVLAYLACRGTCPRAPLFAGLFYGMVTAAISTAVQFQTNLRSSRFSAGAFSDGIPSGFSDASSDTWMSRILNGVHATVGIEESLIPAPLVLGILFVLIHSIRRKDFRVAYVCLWAAVTVVLALVLKGYWQRVPEFDVHRAMVVLAPLSLALVLYVAFNNDEWSNGKTLRLLAISGIVFMILNAAYLPFIRRAPRAYAPYFVTYNEEATMLLVGTAGQDAKTVYLAPPLYFPLETYLSYFSPKTRVVRGFPPAGEHQKGNYVISYIGKEPILAEDPYLRLDDHPVGYRHSGPHLQILPE